MGQAALFVGSGVFRMQRRLTAFRSARKIVRTRTKCRQPVSLFMLPDTTAASADKIRCDACPVMCYIKPGAAGACDRYANHNGELVRVDPHVVLERTVSHGGRLVPFQAGGDWDGKIVHEPNVFVTAIGAGPTYPDYKPAPFIVSSEIDGV